ncbi:MULTISPECIES: SDR family oxidoreductase [unclassified Herbaspirillum]|uniref:SDR family oxidoreductase n=1 Tax=unclassified Herbaspirillum TaxID=2624150 RepID=UPI0011508F6C|nr:MULTISPECIES: SDR family oxidoreductase [unclassified Herbaspirillum]MBB5390111.1 NAD(P)-dependent dehydrogenase (short-subunit alcohol dehydrogenase family) [Herbaspirillum sp. SJZ102]TQK09390.1 NAD(P)-dependent dehydrogenase (short-subunit alcohol dehydrogenase family) [Herbaspirillum sp. SJZ130]TQK13923.1 NAD(P)-dependent dehydrogenase (short-subunit alcohol dehydrogenase family) [Herbaspirillum sp. SJZ106]
MTSQPYSRTAPRVALVTGAARRIGRHIALALAHAGWDVAVHYNRSRDEADDVVREIEALGRRALGVRCELGNEEEVRGLLQQAAPLGRVSCVVNNASLFDFDDAASFGNARLMRHMCANVGAPVLLAQALFEATPEGGQSVVVNLLDQKLYNPNPDYLSYTLSKAALHSATTLLAQALAPRVRVVGVAPGITMASGDQTAEEFGRAHQVTPLGKSSTPDDIAAAVCYVASAPAVTGATLLVDGGQHLLPLSRDVMFVAK